MWALCISQADKHDTAMAERWKADMEGILLYTGVFSATVAAFLVESYKTLRPDPGEVSARLLRQVTEQLAAISNGTQLPPPTTEDPFRPKRYAVHVNILWFLSLFLSLSCALGATLVQKWASRYLRLAQFTTTPQSRVRLRTYLFDGVQKFQTRWVVENISLLMHGAIFLFFAGLIEFIFAVNDEVAYVILVAVSLLAAAYIVVTALPVFFHQCPYQTPLTSIIWYTGHFLTMGTLGLLACSNRIRARIEESWKHTRDGIDSLLVNKAEHKIEIDEKALKSALRLCRDDSELETFLDAIPGYLWPGDSLGTRVANIGSVFDVTGEEANLGQRIVQLFASCINTDRRMDSDARRRRAITCARAIWEITRAFLSDSSTVVQGPRPGGRICDAEYNRDPGMRTAENSEVKNDSTKGKGKDIVAKLGDTLDTRYQGCQSSDDMRLTAVTNFISNVLEVIPDMRNTSHEDLNATRRTLQELCDGLEGRTFSHSAQQSFAEALGETLKKRDASAKSTAEQPSGMLPMVPYYSVIISSTIPLVNILDTRFKDILRQDGLTITYHNDNLEALLDPQTGFAPRLRQLCEQHARKTEPPLQLSARSLLVANPYTPTSALAQATMAASRTLSELVVGLWTGNIGRATEDVVHEMDPDAVTREAEFGRSLAADDASYDKALSHTLFAYVRAGNIEDAVKLCRDAHQPWHAASIRGSLLFSWTATPTTRQGDAVEEDEEEDPDLWHGNKRRALWKTTCTRVLKSACRAWEDAPWGQRSPFYARSGRVRPSRGSAGDFWGPSAREEEGEAGEEEDAWRADVEQELQALATVQVQEGLGADHPFHISQLHIILDHTDALLDDFASRLRDGAYDPESSEYPTMTRLRASVSLPEIDISVSPLAIQIILEAYLQVLEGAGQRSLIAMYTGALGDNAVERYAHFLTSLAPSAGPTERDMALQRPARIRIISGVQPHSEEAIQQNACVTVHIDLLGTLVFRHHVSFSILHGPYSHWPQIEDLVLLAAEEHTRL
ncbi:107-domain-containing protein [Lactifluus subvellereus]|nr:107-domain-containing protein [Lactifluus subvellereus]